MSIYSESTAHHLPSLKLPSLFDRDDNNDPLRSMMLYPDNHNDILLPPILSNMPPSPPFSSCSSYSSSSSLPSSPSSVSEVSFALPKKGSIQSLLNSGSELLELEKKQTKMDVTTKKKKLFQPYQKDIRPTKGLRLFSKQVCDKVAEKGTTTYNQVADELAAEIHQHSSVDQKNIRRRVYDALNVLMALDIITKDRKQIKWLGMPTTDLEQELKKEESRHKALLGSVQQSRHVLNDALVNFTRLEKLVQRNRQQQASPPSTAIHLPFFMMSSQSIHTDTDGREALIQLGSSYAIYQDTDVLAKLWPNHQVTTVS